MILLSQSSSLRYAKDYLHQQQSRPSNANKCTYNQAVLNKAYISNLYLSVKAIIRAIIQNQTNAELTAENQTSPQTCEESRIDR
jgi:hypothetical protein